MTELLGSNFHILLCFTIGTGLLILEVFLPSFGIVGIMGILLELASVVLVYLRHGELAALGMLVACLAVVSITISIAIRSASKGRLSKTPIILTERETLEEGYSATADMEVFLGRDGITTTVLRPTGMAVFDGVKLNVVSDGEYIDKEVAVRIMKVEGTRVVVERLF